MITPLQIRSRVQDYLNNIIEGSDLVKCIDDAVSNDDVYDYSQELQDVILKYQDLFALYVHDPIKRLEYPAYYGPEKLKVLARDLGRELDVFDLENDF